MDIRSVDIENEQLWPEGLISKQGFAPKSSCLSQAKVDAKSYAQAYLKFSAGG